MRPHSNDGGFRFVQRRRSTRLRAIDTEKTLNDTLPTSLWEYVPLSDRERPEEPTGDRLRTILRSLKERFWPWSSGDAAGWKGKLDAPPKSLVDEVVPFPDAVMASAALGRALDAQLAHGESSVLVLFEPGGVTREALAQVARERGWTRVEAPSQEALLSPPSDWPEAIDDAGDAPLVIPALERCYLRHHRGLDAVRRLLDRIARNGDRWIVGCDSWAWSYLSEALHADAIFPTRLALQGFGAKRLMRWLRELTGGSEWVFRDAASGACLLRADAEANGPETDSEEDSDAFFEVLAGRTRGLPGVARAIWRYSLSVEVTDEAKKKAEDEPGDELRQTLWVTPWSRMTLPSVPSGSSQADLFALHALLLHGGLDEDTLELLSPPSSGEPAALVLRRLQRARLVATREGTWRVDVLAYPAVARQIADHFGLGDAF